MNCSPKNRLINFILFMGLIVCVMIVRGFAATKIITMEELYKAFRIRVDQKRIFIGQEATIFIHSAKDFKLIKKFGQAGEGPQEFKLYPEFSPEIDVQSHLLVLTSLGKVSLYTKDGEFIRELKFSTFGPQFYRLMADGFICNRFKVEDNLLYEGIQLLDKELKVIKIFHRHLFHMQRNKKYNPITRGIYIPNFFLNKDLIYVGGKIDDGKIHVYNSKGELVNTINLNIDKTPFTAQDKQGFIDFYMLNDAYKEEYHRLKHLFKYPEYFPLFQNFIVTGSRIFVQTFQRDKEDRKNLFYILNLKGEPLKKVWLPLVEYQDFTPSPYIIGNGKLYQLAENQDTEVWYLHVTKIGERGKEKK